ncbi:MAG: glycosyltransferase family 4 protein [Microcystaceae cyanobacterium]
MKLTILNQFYPPDYAATGQLLEELGAELSKKGLEVEVFVGQPGYAYDQELANPNEVRKGILVRRTRTSRIWPERIRGRAVGGLLYCLRVLVKLRFSARRGDIVLATTEPPYLLITAFLLNLLYRTPYVCLIYDLYPDVAVELGVVPEAHIIVKVWRWLNRLTWQRASKIIVLSATMKQLVLARQPELANKITVIDNWADGHLIRPIAKADNWFALENGLEKVFTVLYSGNLGRCHDLQTIMEAALLLRDQPVRFVFIGAGAKLPICRDFVALHQLENCLFLPFQPKEVLPYSLTAGDLNLVSVLEEAEGLVAPSKFYSCLASGRAIAAICPPHSYLREIIQRAGCGGAINNGDPDSLAQFILDLATNRDTVATMGAKSRQYFQENFTLESITEKYLDVIEAAFIEASK